MYIQLTLATLVQSPLASGSGIPRMYPESFLRSSGP
jgi:hypothetical protein